MYVYMNYTERDHIEERTPKAGGGMGVLFLTTLLMLAATVLFIISIFILVESDSAFFPGGLLLIVSVLWWCIGWLPYLGLKIIRPNEALVLTLFGRYYGTLKREGFYYVNPFCAAVNPAAGYSGALASPAAPDQPATAIAVGGVAIGGAQNQQFSMRSKIISLKVSTLNNDRQKINDQLGNPIIIGIVVIWKVINPTKAVLNVDNYKEFLSIQCDSALRNIVRLYPYDTFGNDNEKTLRGSSQEISLKLKVIH
jgi:regulator of protease activity HflC (stomatin/prohibitin superfamily)